MGEESRRMEHAADFRRTYNESLTTQAEAALEYMELYGSITPLEALQAFGCLRLSARIADLREQGYVIRTDICGGKKRYAIYSLVADEDVE